MAERKPNNLPWILLGLVLGGGVLGLFGIGVYGGMSAMNDRMTVELPRTSDANPSPEDSTVVQIDAQGGISVDGKAVTLADLKFHLLEITDNDLETRVYLRTTNGVEYGAVMKAISEVNAAGFKNMSLVTDPVTASQ